MTIIHDPNPKRAKSPWRKTWTAPDGRQRKLYFKSEEEALAHRDDSKKIGLDLATLPKRDRQAALLATTIAKEHGFGLVDAVKYYISQTGVKEDILFSEAGKLFLDGRKGYATRTNQSLKSTIRGFAFHEDLRLREYCRDDVLEYVRLKTATQTQHSELTRLKTIFNWAKREGYVANNPCDNISKEKDLGKVPPRSITFFTFEEVERLMRTCLRLDRELVAYFTLGLFCGIRPSEITGEGGKQNVTWDDIIIDEDVAEVNVPSSSSKTREPRQVELSKNAIAWLRLGGQLPPRNFRDRRKAVYTAAGVKWSEDIMRHTFASYHCRMYRQPERLKLEMGHAENSRTLFNHYRSGKVTLADARAFWSLMPYEILPSEANPSKTLTRKTA